MSHSPWIQLTLLDRLQHNRRIFRSINSSSIRHAERNNWITWKQTTRITRERLYYYASATHNRECVRAIASKRKSYLNFSEKFLFAEKEKKFLFDSSNDDGGCNGKTVNQRSTHTAIKNDKISLLLFDLHGMRLDLWCALVQSNNKIQSVRCGFLSVLHSFHMSNAFGSHAKRLKR